MTYAKYANRVKVHPTRYGAKKTQGPNLWLVLHTSEGGEFASSAESLGSFMTTPATATNVASYHVIFDTDQVIPCVPYDTVAYAGAGANAQGIHGCFPGKAGQSRDEWLDVNSRAMIKQCARWLCDVGPQFGIPLNRITPSGMANYLKGVADHYTVTLAFRKTNHTDVGPNFPWDVLAADVLELTLPPPPPLPPPKPPTVFPPATPNPLLEVLNMYQLGIQFPAGIAILRITGTHVVHEKNGTAEGIDKWMGVPYKMIGDSDAATLFASRVATGPCPFTDPNSGWYSAALTSAWRT
jgi:hypothetical protein